MNRTPIPDHTDLTHYEIIGSYRNVDRDGTGIIDLDLLPRDQSKRLGPEKRVSLRLDALDAARLINTLEKLIEMLK